MVAPIMGYNNALLLLRPCEKIGIRRITEAHLVSGDDICVWNAKQQPAQDDMIEILINEQPQHDRAVYPIGFPSPFSRTAAHWPIMRERSSAISAWYSGLDSSCS